MASPTNERQGLLPGWTRQYRNELGLIVAIIAVIGIALIFSRDYLYKPGYNATEILRQTSLLGIFALGAAIVIISGGIDLSSGSMIAFGGSVCCLVMLALGHWVYPDAADPTKNLATWIVAVAILATVLTGLLVGTLHTWLVTVVRLPPFVATLASLVGLRSFARILNQAATEGMGDSKSVKINIQDTAFGSLGSTWWIPLCVFVTLSLLAWLLMNRTVIGRHLYAMGGNEEAAKLSGIRTERLKWIAYCIGATTAAIAGVLYSSEVGSADPQTQGRGYELYAIAAAVVGGCSLQGGVGLIPGVFLGALFLRLVIDAVAKVIGSGSDDYEGLIVGFLVVLAVAFNELRRHTGGAAKQFFPGLLGWVTIPILAAFLGTVLTITGGVKTGGVSGIVVLFILVVLKIVGNRKSSTAS
jgi:ribose/xylose/arabinose/galactoside ABC-type transport system permease subunit